jgi:hypothetical protein
MSLRDQTAPPDPVEVKIGELYVEFYRLRKAGRYQDEYDVMGTLIKMLTQDRAHLRDPKFGVKI